MQATAQGTLTVLYFAWLRERVGVAEEQVAPPRDVTTVGALIAWLKVRSPGHEAALSGGKLVRCAVNQDFAGLDAAIAPGDEVAFFPPVTGG